MNGTEKIYICSSHIIHGEAGEQHPGERDAPPHQRRPPYPEPVCEDARHGGEEEGGADGQGADDGGLGGGHGVSVRLVPEGKQLFVFFLLLFVISSHNTSPLTAGR